LLKTSIIAREKIPLRKLTFLYHFGIFSANFLPFPFSDEKKNSISQFENGQEDYPSFQTLGGFSQKEDDKKAFSMKGEKKHLLFAFFLVLTALACTPQPRTSVLLRDLQNPPPAIQDVFAKEGVSDYLLLKDEGYSFRLVYLCANRIYNFVDEPENNPVLVSLQPLLDTPVEKKLSAEDRKRIWTCWEEKVRAEHSQVEERKKSIAEERKQLEKEIVAALKEQDRISAEIALKKKLAEQRKRQIEAEKRRAEEERLRRIEEEQRRKIEEERKVKAYKAGEKEKEAPPPLPPKVSESGIFLVMKDAHVYEGPQNTSKIKALVKKYDILGVINSQKDKNGMQWHQFILSERIISKKGKKIGWTPEERNFWEKHKLLVWIYPGDLTKINTIKPLKLNVEEIQYTGKKGLSPSQTPFYEVNYEEDTEYVEKILGWVEEQNGIRRADKNEDEMIELLQKLALTLWPIKIQNDVLRGFIRVGFTPEQVVLAWGKPDHINTKTLMKVHQQWVYGAKPFPKAYVYFEDGLVKNWEFLKK
jgi:hypothetical protein